MGTKLKKILLSVLAGIDVTFYMFTPMIIATIWLNISDPAALSSKFIFGIGLFATLFRAIKIGWLKGKND